MDLLDTILIGLIIWQNLNMQIDIETLLRHNQMEDE